MRRSSSRSTGSSPDNAKPFNGVSYFDLKKHCLKQRVLFEDPDFPAVDETLFFSKKPPRPFEWKRPKEIVSDPHLLVGGASSMDVDVGMLGDAWLIAAMSSLALYPGLCGQVVPPDQNFTEEYVGLFRFRFWRFGEWVEVVVDDRLPTYNNKLVFTHCKEPNEFWAPLLEKAYAKLTGSYESLKGGQIGEAMEDFTGGITERIDTAKVKGNFFRDLVKAFDRQSLIGCSIDTKPNEGETKLPNGLTKGHAYTVTAIRKVNARGNELELIRVRNPWGNEREWNGNWADGTKDWKMLSESEKKSMGLTFDDDGEFWMSFSDFTTNFTTVEVCSPTPDLISSSEREKWDIQVKKGTWQKHVTAGGCRNFPESFHLNPQYRMVLDDTGEENRSVLISLMQMNRRKQKRVGAQNLTIGFSIYKIEDDAEEYIDDGRYNKEFFLYHKSYARSNNFLNSRSVTESFSFPPGLYIVIPSTFKAGEEGDFLLRIFTDKGTNVTEMDGQNSVAKVERPKLTEEEKSTFDVKFKSFFDKVAGQDGDIDPFELQMIVNAAFKKEMEGREFSLTTCRHLVALVDSDISGKIAYEEFRLLWTTTMNLKNAFNRYDKDSSGDMNAVELRDALSKLGYKLSTPALSTALLRYVNKKGNVSLDDFISIAVQTQRIFELYHELRQAEGRLSLDDLYVSVI